MNSEWHSPEDLPELHDVEDGIRESEDVLLAMRSDDGGVFYRVGCYREDSIFYSDIGEWGESEWITEGDVLRHKVIGWREIPLHPEDRRED
jgi:hypothetical protein